MAKRRIVRASCLCGGVRFEVEPPFLRAGHCHCSRCRKHAGAAFGTQARVPRERFRLLTGAELVRVWPTPDEALSSGAIRHAVKAFCATCGSSLFGGTWPDGPEVSIRMGAFDDDPGIRPSDRAFFDSRAPWDETDDELPRHPGARPRA